MTELDGGLEETQIQLDAAMLADVGLKHLPPAETKVLLGHVYETLESRVGMRIAGSMSSAELDEFEQLMDAGDDSGALRWLEINRPQYKEDVRTEMELLKVELRQLAPTILALTGAF